MKPLKPTVQLCMVLLLVAAGGHGGVGPALAQVEPRADEILHAMGSYPAFAEEFHFHAGISYDNFSVQGQELQYGDTIYMVVEDPREA